MKAKPGFVIREICGENILVAEGEENIDFSNIISMNETSSFIWNKIVNMDSFTVDDMCSFILKEYDVDEATVRKDCEKLAAQWGKIGIISGDDIPQIDVEVNYVGNQKPEEEPEPEIKKEPKKQGFFGKIFHKH